MRICLRGCARAMCIPILTSATVKPARPSRARRVPVVPVHARRARRAAASVAPAVPAVTAAPAAPVAPAPHTGIPTHRVSRRDPPTSRFRRGPPEGLLVDSGIQKCHGCVGDPRLTPKMRGSTLVPRADGDPQLSIGDPGTTFHRRLLSTDSNK